MEGEAATETQRKAETEAAHAVVPGNIITTVPRWLSSGTVKRLSHSTCHPGPPLQWDHTHKMESHKCQMITHDMCFVTHEPESHMT